MPAGAPAMLKLARRWGCPDLRAAALLRQVDAAPANALRLYLIALRERLFLSVRGTLMSWSPGDARVVIRPGGGERSGRWSCATARPR